MERAAAKRLPDGRLHLHHGPIDLIITLKGAGKAAAGAALVHRFETVLEDLVEELPMLRSAITSSVDARGVVAGRMVGAVQPFLPEFITPMAAVAGAVSDEMIATARSCEGVTKAVVNNGGDVAVFLSEGETVTAEIFGTGSKLHLKADWPWRGVASSGWQGRSWSFGIADIVTVIGHNAASADAAATMIANRVDLPSHSAIRRQRARDVASESDLGDRLVTTGVGRLTDDETKQALSAGADYARGLLERDLIGAAVLTLNGEVYHVGEVALLPNAPERETEDA